MKVYVTERPYILIFLDSGNSYQLTSEEAQRIIDNYPVLYASRNMVKLQLHNSKGVGAILKPATLGGGPAFTVEKVTVALRSSSRKTNSSRKGRR